MSKFDNVEQIGEDYAKERIRDLTVETLSLKLEIAKHCVSSAGRSGKFCAQCGRSKEEAQKEINQYDLAQSSQK